MSRSPKAKARRCRIKSAHKRGLGYVELNKFNKKLSSHHIDLEHVIYIPKYVHKAIKHNNQTGINMDEINLKAIKYMFDHPDTMIINTISFMNIKWW